MKNTHKVGLGVLFFTVFLGFVAFGLTIKVETKPQAVEAVICPANGVTMKVDFTSTTSNIPKTTTLSNGTVVGDDVFFNVTNVDGSAIVDPSLSTNKQKLQARRDSGKVEFFAHYWSTVSTIQGIITISGSTFTSTQNSVNGLSDSMWPGNTGYGMDIGQDSLTITSPTTVSFSMTFNEPGDSFTLFFDLCTPPATTIVCTTNSNCGTNGFTGNLTCQNNDVYQNYRTYTCNNPGTASAFCSNANNSQLKQMCAGAQACDIGGCFPETW